MVSGRSSSLVAVVLAVPSLLKMVPVPSSLIVPVPDELRLDVLVAVRVKTSPLSATPSFVMGVRTSTVPEAGTVTLVL